jgi:amino acid adenylation domain-containing protein
MYSLTTKNVASPKARSQNIVKRTFYSIPDKQNRIISIATMDNITINRIFEDVADKFSKKIAVTTASGNISYEELNRKANRIAHALQRMDLARQSIVGIYLQTSFGYIAAIIGIMKSGNVFMPVNIQTPVTRLDSVLEKTRPSVIITDKHLKEDLLEKLKQINASLNPIFLLTLDDSLGFDIENCRTDARSIQGIDYPDINPPDRTELEDACYIITTSGSTGEPKAILGVHKGLSHFIQWEVNEFNLGAQEKVSLLSPVTFDVSLRDIFVPLSVGGTLCIPAEETRTNPRKLTQWFRETEISVTHIIPTLFRLVTQEVESFTTHENIFPAMKYVFTAGEVLYWNDVAKWRNSLGRSVELINFYGPSETTLAKLFYRIRDRDPASEEAGSVPLGRPIPDTEVMIIHNGEKCPVGATGEIYIKTDFRSRGYYNAPEMNSLAFVQNPLLIDREDIVYKTGDLGKFLPDGCVKFTGRVDNQIKLHGVRIEPTEIESVLNQHNQVRQSAVIAIDDTFGNKQLAAYIVPKTGENPTVESLRRFTEQRVPDYAVPALYINIESLPLTHNGKIDRSALPAPPRIRPEMEERYIAPSTDMEQILCKIWSKVLNIDRVGIRDNFFYLGGTSLLIVRASEIISKELAIDLPVTKMFEYPKIKSLAEYLTGPKQADHSSSHEDIQQRAQRRKASLSHMKQTRINK